MKPSSTSFLLLLIIVAIGVLIYASYQTGFKKSKNELGSLLMTMKIDSNIVTTGLYEELPNNVRKTIQFYIEESPATVSDIKLYAEVKYIKIGSEVISAEDGKIWDFIKGEKIFKRRFEQNNEDGKSEKKEKKVPNSKLATIN